MLPLCEDRVRVILGLRSESLCGADFVCPVFFVRAPGFVAILKYFFLQGCFFLCFFITFTKQTFEMACCIVK